MRQRPGLAALLPIALLLLAGCSAERASQAAPLPPLRTPSAAPSASLSPSLAPIAAPVAVAVPAEASANTPQGASAFARFYFAELLRAYTTYDTRAVRSLAAETCRTCAGLTGGIDSMRQAQQRVTGPPLAIHFAEAPGFGYGPVTVDVQYSIPEYKLVDGQGTVVRHFLEKKNRTFIVTLERAGQGWLMGRIQVP